MSSSFAYLPCISILLKTEILFNKEKNSNESWLESRFPNLLKRRDKLQCRAGFQTCLSEETSYNVEQVSKPA